MFVTEVWALPVSPRVLVLLRSCLSGRLARAIGLCGGAQRPSSLGAECWLLDSFRTQLRVEQQLNSLLDAQIQKKLAEERQTEEEARAQWKCLCVACRVVAGKPGALLQGPPPGPAMPRAPIRWLSAFALRGPPRPRSDPADDAATRRLSGVLLCWCCRVFF